LLAPEKSGSQSESGSESISRRIDDPDSDTDTDTDTDFEKIMAKTLLTILLSAVSLLPAHLSAKPSPPNIVFLMTDDQRWDNFGCYGRPEFRTANIDRLAKEGVVFDRAYHAVGICMPSRATVFTGRYFSSHRVGFTHPYNMTMSKADYDQSYPAQLKRAGYRTGFVGKFGFAVTDDAYPTKSTVTGYSLEKHLAPYFDYFAGSGVHVKGAHANWPNDERLKAIFDRKRPAEERTLKTGDAMLHFLDTHPKGQPFCLSVSFYAVKHYRDSDVYPPHLKAFEKVKFPLPKNWVEGRNTKLPKVLDHWRGVKQHLKSISTTEKASLHIRRFAAQGYSVDLQVGRLVEKLEEMGELDNTVIIYTSDNGRFQGSHGLGDKAVLYEEAIKAPLIVFDGRLAKEKRGRRESALVSTADFAPTMLALAGVDLPPSMQGKSLTNVLEQKQDKSTWRDAVLMENLFLHQLHIAGVKKHADIPGLNDEMIATNQSYRSRGVRTDRYKYFAYFEHTPVIEELYDLNNDPHEQHNLATNPEYAPVLANLRKRAEELHKKIAQ
jgi:arylsulfatase A-like enzyme